MRPLSSRIRPLLRIATVLAVLSPLSLGQPSTASGYTNTGFGNDEPIASVESDSVGIQAGVSEVELGHVKAQTLTPEATIGAMVWNDDDANGARDAHETGTPEVTVVLLDEGGIEISRTLTEAETGKSHPVTIQAGQESTELDAGVSPNLGAVPDLLAFSGSTNIPMAALGFVLLIIGGAAVAEGNRQRLMAAARP